MRSLFGLLALSLVFAFGCSSSDIVEDVPTVSFTQTTQTTLESDGTVDIVVRRTGPSAEDVQVDLRLDASASAASPSDLGQFERTVVTFPASAASEETETIAIDLTPDEALEGEEVAAFVLENPVNARLGTPALLALTVADAFDYDAVNDPDFETQVQPLLAARCGDCHGGSDPAGGLDVSNWASLLDGSDQGEAFIAFDSANSLMVELATKLPEGNELYEAHRLPEEEVAFLQRWIDQGAKGPDGTSPFADVSNRLYVCNQMAGQVSIIDLDRLVVARNVSFAEYGMPMATNPHDVDVEPDGSRWYVSLINAHRVLQYDAATNEVIAEAQLDDSFKPGMLALDATSDRLYSGRSFSDASGIESIVAINRNGMTWEEIVVPYTRPHPIGVTNDGAYLLSGSLAQSQAAAFDTQTLDVVGELDVDDSATALVHYAVSPVGDVAVLTGQNSGEIYFLDVSDPEDLSVLGVVAVGNQPWHPTYSPDGNRVYVPNRLSNTVSVVDASDPSNPTVVATIEDDRFAMPHGSAISDDGRYLFVSSRNQQFEDGSVRYTPRYPLGDNMMVGNVAVIDTQSNTVVKVIEVEEFASGLAVSQP